MNVKCVFGAIAVAVAGQAVAQGPTLLPGESAGLLENDYSLLYGQHSAIEPFVDVFSFDVSSPGVATAIAIEADVSKYPDPGNLVFSFSYLALTDAAYNVIASDVDGTDGWAINLAPLSLAGTYRVIVNGSVVSAVEESIPGAYLGSVATAVTAVPEPASYMLLMAGLAAVGFSARRRAHC